MHIIRKKIFDISLYDSGEPRAISSEIEAFVKHIFLEQIAFLCDEVCPKNIHIRLENVFIDLEELSASNWRHELVERFREKAKLLFSQPDNRTHIQHEEAFFESFEFFIRTGQAAWWSSPEYLHKFEDTIEDILKNQAGRLDRLQNLLEDDICARRIISQLSDTVLENLGHLLMTHKGLSSSSHYYTNWIKIILFDLLKSSSGNRNDDYISWKNQIATAEQRQRYWRLFFKMFNTIAINSQSNEKEHTKIVAHIIAKWLQSDEIEVLKNQLSLLLNQNRINKYPLAESQKSRITSADIIDGQPSILPQSDAPKPTEIVPPLAVFAANDWLTELIHNLHRIGTSGHPEKKPKEDGVFIESFKENFLHDKYMQYQLKSLLEEGVYVKNAGLVLLHPFLTSFFERICITEENQFCSVFHQLRAILLLQYIATGLPTSSEVELPLNKVLCNLDMNIPSLKNIEPTQQEQKEATDMLQAVIKHWTALKNTSIEGLRQLFLVRAGKLSLKKDGSWQLTVESKAQDILLTRLPWSVSTIKLPWMNKLLWVEWFHI